MAGKTLLAAHRGGALLWPENSLLAFRNAIAVDADFLELDVHLSRDGEVVVIHDPTLPTTTTGVGEVRAWTLAELRAFSLKDKDGKVTDQAIPTLDEAVGLAAPTGLRLLLEIKVDARRVRYQGIEENVLAILDRHQMASRSIVMAFEGDTMRRVRELRPDVMVGALYSRRSLEQIGSSPEREIEALPAAGARFVGLHRNLITLPLVEQARSARLILGVWTVNEASAMRRFIELGVDILITDRPDLARELLRR